MKSSLSLVTKIFWLGLLMLFAATVGPAAAVPEKPMLPTVVAHETRPLDTLLQPDGTLDLSSGFSGSLDPSGWELVSGAGERPRFRPAAG
jgi:hypothetical protein